MTQRSQPRRFRRRWAVLAFLLLLMLLLIGWHQLWKVGAGRRLARLVANYQAAGQPIEPQDFVAYSVTPGANAVTDLRAAGAAVDRTSETWKAFVDLPDAPALALRPEEVTLLRAVLEENPKVLPLIESATTKPGVDWQLTFRSPVLGIMLPHLNEQRYLARMLKADALLAHTDGDHARAIRRAGEMLFLSRAVGKQPILVSHLVSIGIGAMSAEMLVNMAEDLRIGGNAGDASPQQVRDLIATLLDESDAAASRRGGLLGERMFQLDSARNVANGKMGLGNAPGANPAVAAVIKPTALDDGVLMLRHTTAVLEAAEKSADWPAYQRIAPVFPAAVREQSWRHVVASIYMPALDRAVLSHYRYLTDRRMTAVILALRLYATEHDGNLPDTLDALVPTYLPAVPLDPMASAQPLQYVPRPSPIVYSIGEDGVNDGGSQQTKRIGASSDRWQWLDAVSHYKRQPRPAPEAFDDGVGNLSLEEDATTVPSTEPGTP